QCFNESSYVPAEQCTQYGMFVGTYQLAEQQPDDNGQCHRAELYHEPAYWDHRRHSKWHADQATGEPAGPWDGSPHVVDRPERYQRAHVDSKSAQVSAPMYPQGQ